MGLLVMMILIIMFVVVLFFISGFLGEKEEYNKRLMRAFECGFVVIRGSRMTFSIQFFLIRIIFLIFDVEVVIVLPIPLLVERSRLIIICFFYVFMMIILFGLYYEWRFGVIRWVD